MLKVQSKMCINYNDNMFKERPYLVAVLLVFIIHVIVLLIDANYAIFILLYYNVELMLIFASLIFMFCLVLQCLVYSYFCYYFVWFM